MKRVVVVGASSGLGRSVAVGLAQRGERVALLARRTEMAEAAAAEAGNDAFAVACDAVDAESACAAIDQAAETMGGLDCVIQAAAIGKMVMLEDATPEQWRDVLDINVIGANNITQAAVPHLRETNGNLLYFSTTGASYTGPWAGLGVYQVSKAAMNHLVGHWRAESPGVGFTVVTIGECPGGEGDAQTQFALEFDRELMGKVAGDWFAKGHMSGNFIDIEELTDQFHGLVRSSGGSMSIPHVTIIPRPPQPAADE